MKVTVLLPPYRDRDGRVLGAGMPEPREQIVHLCRTCFHDLRNELVDDATAEVAAC